MDIDLNTLKMVLAVADCASYTRAAQKLGITQPAVNRRVLGLEQLLRAKLFRRDGHRFLPTEAGLSVCDHARQIVTLVRDGLGCMFLAQSGLRGRVDEASIGYARIHDPVISWTMSVAVRRHGQPTLAARLLMRMIESLVAGLVRDKEWHGKVLAGKR